MRGRRLRAVCESMGLTWRADEVDDPSRWPLSVLHPHDNHLVDWNGLTALVACVAWLIDFHDLSWVGGAVVDALERYGVVQTFR